MYDVLFSCVYIIYSRIGNNTYHIYFLNIKYIENDQQV